MVNSEVSEEVRKQVFNLIDRWADLVEERLGAAGLPRYTSPAFKPFSIAVMLHATGMLVGFATAQGTPSQWILSRPSESYAPESMMQFLQEQQGQEVSFVLSLPRPEFPSLDRTLEKVADAHVARLVEDQKLDQLGDITGVPHIRAELETFLQDHPSFDRNVFVMMPFRDDAQMNAVWSTLRETLRKFGMTAHRADDRDYTGALWTNIEVYLTCCKYGIAVFEQVEVREHNPNVALELGYMLAQQKRTLILKEQRLQNLPTDVIHRLYRPFDIFDIEATVESQVSRWLENDLRVSQS